MLLVHLRHHGFHALVSLRLALWQIGQMGDLRAREEAGGAVGTRRDARAAPDAGRRVHRRVGISLRHENIVRVARATRGRADVSARLDDAIEGAPVRDQVLQHREGRRTPGFDGDLLPVGERAHVHLAGGRTTDRPMRHTVDHHAAAAADALAAVMLECDRLLALFLEVHVHQVDHLEERGIRRDIARLVGLEAARAPGVGLTPHLQREIHYL